jgi:hypothetical protein
MEVAIAEKKTVIRTKKLVDPEPFLPAKKSDGNYVIDEEDVVVEFDATDYLGHRDQESKGVQVDHLNEFSEEDLQRILAMDGTNIIKDPKVQGLFSQLSDLERQTLLAEWSVIDDTPQQPVLVLKHLDILTLTNLWEKAETKTVYGRKAKRMVCESQHCRKMLWVNVEDFQNEGILALVCVDCRKQFT